MSRRESAAPAEPTPSPAPASEQRLAATPRMSLRAAFQQASAHMNMSALREAAEVYGDDAGRELEDIKAGRHPLQRGGRDLDVHERIEAELATIRAARGR